MRISNKQILLKLLLNNFCFDRRWRIGLSIIDPFVFTTTEDQSYHEEYFKRFHNIIRTGKIQQLFIDIFVQIIFRSEQGK